MDKADSGDSANCSHCRSNGARDQEPQYLGHILELECAAEPVLDQPSREYGLTRADEAERDGKPGVPGNQQLGCNRCDGYSGSHRQTRVRSQRDQRTYGDARGWPKDGHSSLLSAKGEAKPRCHEIGNAGRNRDPDRSKPRMAELVEREHCSVAFLVVRP